jgi:hypothetical protein
MDGRNHFSGEGRRLEPNGDAVNQPYIPDSTFVGGFIIISAENINLESLFFRAIFKSHQQRISSFADNLFVG